MLYDAYMSAADAILGIENQPRAQGVDLRTGAKVTGIAGEGRVEAVLLGDGTRVPAEAFVECRQNIKAKL